MFGGDVTGLTTGFWHSPIKQKHKEHGSTKPCGARSELQCWSTQL